jgi:hypothetical protein
MVNGFEAGYPGFTQQFCPLAAPARACFLLMKIYTRPTNWLLVSLASCTLLCSSCGQKQAVAAEPPAAKQPVPQPQPVPAAQPVVPAAQPASNNDQRVAAIFSSNHADKSLDEKLPALEDFISSRITEKGFSVISREVTVGALSSLQKDSKQTSVEQMLNSSSSVLRLAQMLGANYIVMATISSYGTDKQTSDAYDVKTTTVIQNLRVSYKILDGLRGGTLAGDAFKLSNTNRYTANSHTESSDVVNDLLDQSSVKIAESVGAKVIKAPSTASALAEFTVTCGMQDLVNVPLAVPRVALTENNTLIVDKSSMLPVEALNVMVELDGTGIGSTPGKFKVPSGLHNLRLRRDGFKDYEGTITVYQGQVFNVALQMTDAGYQRWKDNTAFLNSLENGRKLNDAEAEKLRGEAQKFRQSGNMVNVKVDTKDNVKVYKSIY